MGKPLGARPVVNGAGFAPNKGKHVMGAIVSDFPSLPGVNDADWIANYQACFSQLQAMGLATPPTPPDLTTRPVLLACLQGHAGDFIKAEVQNDPEGIGYAGMTNAEICEAIQKPRFPCQRLSSIWTGLPFTPNFIDENDIAGALT